MAYLLKNEYHINFFDLSTFIFTNYLSKADLDNALSELHRLLKEDGKLFVVVRSSKCHEATSENSTYDPETGLTRYTSNSGTYARYFHTENSIKDHLTAAGFTIEQIQSYDEQLCIDFQRKTPSNNIDNLIEVVAQK